MKKLQYEEHYKNIVPSIYPQCLSGLGLNDVRDLYCYSTDKEHNQYYVVDTNGKGIFTVNHFVYSTGIADFIEENMKKRGDKIPEKHYQQNVAIDYKTRKEANEDIIRSLKLYNII